MNLYVIALAFGLIVFTELGDKTQLVAISLASRYDHKLVFSSVASALVLVTAIGVAVGTLIFSYIDPLWIKLAAACLFILFGLWTLAKRGEEDDGLPGDGDKIFVKAFSMTFMAEMGDKTQLAAIALTAAYAAPVEVFAGAAFGFVAITAIGVWVGKWLGERLDQGLLEKAGGVLFVALGGFMLIEAIL